MENKNKDDYMNKDNNTNLPNKKDTNMLLAAFIIFIFPMIAIFIGAIIGRCIANATNILATIPEIIGGLAGFVLAAIIIKVFDRTSKINGKIEKIHWDDL